MDDIESYAQRLRLSNQLREPALRAASDMLQFPEGSQGLDAGCGIGLHTVLLAQAIGPRGHVTGLDVSPDFLALAERHAGRLGLSLRTLFRQGDINRLPFENDMFDWAWSVDTVYAGPVGDPFAITHELARVVKPGGQVAVLFWSAQKLLPGYPLLEARLDAGFAQSAAARTTKAVTAIRDVPVKLPPCTRARRRSWPARSARVYRERARRPGPG